MLLFLKIGILRIIEKSDILHKFHLKLNNINLSKVSIYYIVHFSILSILVLIYLFKFIRIYYK